VGSRVIAARYESCLLFLYSLKRLRNVLYAFNTSWIVFWPDQHEVVVHNRIAFDAVPFRDERLFGRFGMDKHNISVATASNVERLTGADRDHFHGDAGLHRKERQYMVEQT
jgi:hypothetical protein